MAEIRLAEIKKIFLKNKSQEENITALSHYVWAAVIT